MSDDELVSDFVYRYSLNELKSYDIAVGSYYKGELHSLSLYVQDKSDVKLIDYVVKADTVLTNDLTNHTNQINNTVKVVLDISKVDVTDYINAGFTPLRYLEPSYVYVDTTYLDVITAEEALNYTIDYLEQNNYIKIFNCGYLELIKNK